MSGDTLPAGRVVAAFDSASAFLRATARALDGRDFARLGQGRLPALGARLTGLLPGRLRRQVYTTFGAREGLPADRLRDVDGEAVTRWVTGHYRGAGRYPAVFVGSSDGALVHLCAATGAPWLPQTMRGPSPARPAHRISPRSGWPTWRPRSAGGPA